MNEQRPQFPPAGPPGTPQQFPPAGPAATPQQIASAESTARIIYILYLVSLAVGVTAIVGVIMAYVSRASAPAGLDTHYRYLIRTFWIGVLYSIVGAILMAVFVGFLVWIFTLAWFIVRCAKGLKYLGQQKPIPEPGTWLW